MTGALTPSPPSINGKFKFSAVVFCEGVRREDNGKLMLLGVPGGDLLIQQAYPANVPLFAHIEGDVVEPGLFSQVFRFVDETGAALSPPIEVKSSAPFVRGGFAVQVFASIVFQRSCTLILQMREEGGWRELARKAVVHENELISRFAPESLSELIKQSLETLRRRS
ncbi:MAG TPA: hypothetical protein VHA70_10330 [Bauldia sp.]|nr:hypothetical protein [Bauldia sp.]